jgi:hypothetical protein
MASAEVNRGKDSQGGADACFLGVGLAVGLDHI